MEFFSDDYLMHYGVKGMKWKKRKNGDAEGFKTPGEYLEEAYEKQGHPYKDAEGRSMANSPGLKQMHKNRLRLDTSLKAQLKRTQEQRAYVSKYKKLAQNAAASADARRNADLKKSRKKAYKANQRRIRKQQVKQKIKNFVGR